MSIRLYPLMVFFSSFLYLLIFFLVVLSIAECRLLKTPIMTVGLSVSLCSFIIFFLFVLERQSKHEQRRGRGRARETLKQAPRPAEPGAGSHDHETMT